MGRNGDRKEKPALVQAVDELAMWIALYFACRGIIGAFSKKENGKG